MTTPTRTYDSPRRRAQADATRAAILSAFAEQFGRPGITDVSVPEAARRARVSTRTVYHYFPTREARLEALAKWADEVTGPVGSVLEVAEDIPDHIRLAYARAHRHESLTRAMVAAGFSEEVRRRRLRDRRAQFDELLAAIGADEERTRRASAVIAMLATSEAGIPLVDIHGLTFAEAGDAAAEAVEVIIRDLRQAAARR